MRVALVTDGIWPFVIGGMQKHSFYLCKYLAKAGINVDLYHTAGNEKAVNLSNCFSADELKYITSHFVESAPSRRFPGHYLFDSYKYSAKLYDAVLANHSIDLIYAKGLTSWAFFKRKHKGASLPPICVNVHGYEYYQRPATLATWVKHLMLRVPFSYINEQADYVYSYGGRITEIIERNIKRRKGKIIEIPTGIESAVVNHDISGNGTSTQFVYIGRSERRKGIPEINRAIRMLDQRYPFHFHFVGEIPRKHRIQSSNVTYYDVIDRFDKIQRILRNSHVLVCPSYAEGMPNVILEGMASGCAIIATDVGAINTQVDRNNGWLIRPGSVTELFEAMVAAISLPSEELLYKRNSSRDKVKREFLWNTVVMKVIESFNDILNARARKDPGVPKHHFFED